MAVLFLEFGISRSRQLYCLTSQIADSRDLFSCWWSAMRNVFDQFKEPENRLTHALMSSLNEDSILLKEFIHWVTEAQLPVGELIVQEQSLPGELEEPEGDEEERRGLPDGCIHNGESWALVIESKIASPLESDQIRRHRLTVERRGFTKISLLALVVTLPQVQMNEGLIIKKWSDLYCWLQSKNRSEWATRLGNYMEILEARLPKEQYLKDGTLTVFSGIPFGKATPYTYFEARRIIRLLAYELRSNLQLQSELGVDLAAKGRGAITGQESDFVWDYLPIGAATGAKSFTEFPHLTVGIHRGFIQALVIVPNGIRTDFRKAFLGSGYGEFHEQFRHVLVNLRGVIGDQDGVVPIVEAVQRRYPSQRSAPFMDATVEFDLRTAFENDLGWHVSPKQQPQWLTAVYESLSQKRSNIQIAVGARFQYDSCSWTQTPEIAGYLAKTWLACKPIIDRMFELP